MIIFTFDGTFEGMLTAIYQAVYRRETNAQILCQDLHQESLFDQTFFVETNTVEADKVCSAIKSKISRGALAHIMYAFLTGDPHIGTYVYRYLDSGWKTGSKLDMYLDDNRVKKIHDLSSRVRREKHRMLGLLRFRRLSLHYEVYYAPYEPDNNITMFLAPHFVQRLQDQNWIIHDIKRSIAACYNGQEWMVTDLALSQVPPLGEDETLYQSLWRQYYQSISIPGRRNPKLQRQMMPARYWKHLTEKMPE